MLFLDSAVWQRLLQFGKARVSDLSGQSKPLQICHPLEMHQACVGDLGVGEPQPFQLCQSLEMHQSRVGDFGVPKVKFNHNLLVIVFYCRAQVFQCG